MTKRIPIAFVSLAIGASIVSTRAAESPVTDWPSYNRTLMSDRYVPFDQINKTNVSRLKQVCVYDLNVDGSFQSGPIVIGRTMYLTTDKEIMAIDADTCQQRWRTREEGPSLALRVNRGAAHLDGRLFRGTGEGNVLAYDAATGTKVWSTHIAEPARSESVPAAPIAWNGLVFIGTAGSDRYGVKGRMYALDAKTGMIVCGKPTQYRPTRRNRATRRCRRWPKRRGATRTTCRLPAAARGPLTHSIPSEVCCTSPLAIPVQTSRATYERVRTCIPMRF